MDLLDEIEKILKIQCAPITWPIGMGKLFKGVYNLVEDAIYLYQAGKNYMATEAEVIPGLDNKRLDELLGMDAKNFRDEIELVHGASHSFDQAAFLSGKLTPVFFGSAINNFGIKELLDAFVENAPPPTPRATTARVVKPTETNFSGFVFKIQANMDPAHRDRIAFMRIASGQYRKGMKMQHVRINKNIQINNALTFMAGERENLEQAYAGDIIGLHNHGTIQIGDTFTIGENLKFSGIPNFAPELFRSVRLKDPLRQKSLLTGLTQLSEEGATQLFKPLDNNELILGAIGVLQFDVVAYRLQNEYNVHCVYDATSIVAARWVSSNDKKLLEKFKNENSRYLALDGAGSLTYLAPSRVNLDLVRERYSEIEFHATREH